MNGDHHGNDMPSVKFVLVAVLLFVDIDRFHVVNESMGHLIGDEALRLLAERMSAVLGGPGYLARFAGDEFVAIAPALDEAKALALAGRLREAIALPIEGDGYRLFLSASIGAPGASDWPCAI